MPRISLLAVCAGLGSWPALAEPPGPFDDEPAPLAWIDSGDGVALALTSPGRDAIVRYELFHGALRVSWSEGPLPDLTSVVHTLRAPSSALSHPRMRTHVSTLMVRLQSEGRSWRAPAIGVVLEPHADGGWSLRRLPDSDRAEDADPTQFHNRRSTRTAART